jgi:hypothetical protein
MVLVFLSLRLGSQAWVHLHSRCLPELAQLSDSGLESGNLNSRSNLIVPTRSKLMLSLGQAP